MTEEKKNKHMKRQAMVLLSALVVGILGVVFWELEYQHVSLVLWLLVIVAVLWCCAEVAVSLRVSPSARREHARSSKQPRPRRNRWMGTLVGAVIVAGLGVVFWLLGFETTSQLLWFLVLVALLWGCAQVSLLLRPDGRGRYTHNGDGERPVSASWARKRTVLDRLLPGVSLRSGVYNRGDEEAWDGNEKLPPSYY